MKKTAITLVAAVGIFAACNNQTEQKETTTTDSITKPEMTTMQPARSCYASFSNGDTVEMKVEAFENSVVGLLTYKLKEKDSNKGEFDGVFKGDTLIADYRFMSEGKESVRQVAFLIKDGKATEGYGDVEEKEGKMVFKNTGSLSFGKGIVLNKTECTY